MMIQKSNQDRSKSPGYDTSIEVELQRLLKPKKRWPRMLGVSALGLTLVAAIGVVAMNFGPVAGMFGEVTPAQADTAKPALPDSPFVQHVKQARLKACTDVFPVLGRMLTNGTKFEIKSSWGDPKASTRAIQSLVGMDYATKQYSGPAAGVVFAAPSGSGCDGAMVRVVPFAAACSQIPALLPTNSKLSNDLGRVAIYELPGNGGEALLLPAGQSCVVISVATAATR